MKVVGNATPLIALSLINRLDLLPALFEEIVVPRAVYEEIVVQGGGRVGAAALSNQQFPVKSLRQIYWTNGTVERCPCHCL